jgi:hypothetical protein
VASPAGCSLWVSPAEPGSVHDITAARIHAVQRSLRRLGERAFALLNQRWRALQHITASSGKITGITRAALVLTQYEHGYIK